jgi:hypothetical protein
MSADGTVTTMANASQPVLIADDTDE